MNRAQMSVESVIILGALLVVAVMLLVVFSSRSSDIDREKERILAQQLADQIVSVAHSVYIANANDTFYFPQKIATHEYNVTFGEHLVIVFWEGYSTSATSVAPLNSSVRIPATHSKGSSYTFVFRNGVISVV